MNKIMILIGVIILLMCIPVIDADTGDYNYEGKVLDIDYDFTNEKTVVFLDTATIIIDGLETGFIIGREYRISVDSGGNLESFVEIRDSGGSSDGNGESSDNVAIIVAVIVGCLAVIIIVVIIIFAMKKKGPEDEDEDDEDDEDHSDVECKSCGALNDASDIFCVECNEDL